MGRKQLKVENEKKESPVISNLKLVIGRRWITRASEITIRYFHPEIL
jgi:hypothetical protein